MEHVEEKVEHTYSFIPFFKYKKTYIGKIKKTISRKPVNRTQHKPSFSDHHHLKTTTLLPISCFPVEKH